MIQRIPSYNVSPVPTGSQPVSAPVRAAAAPSLEGDRLTLTPKPPQTLKPAHNEGEFDDLAQLAHTSVGSPIASAVGLGVGFMLGGPVGAAIGSVLGGMAIGGFFAISNLVQHVTHQKKDDATPDKSHLKLAGALALAPAGTLAGAGIGFALGGPIGAAIGGAVGSAGLLLVNLFKTL